MARSVIIGLLAISAFGQMPLPTSSVPSGGAGGGASSSGATGAVQMSDGAGGLSGDATKLKFDPTASVLTAGDPGDVTLGWLVGTPLNAFNPLMAGVDANNSKFVFSHKGTSNNLYNGLVSIMQTTDTGETAITGTAASSGTDGLESIGISAFAGSTGTVLMDAKANNAAVLPYSSGDIRFGYNYFAQGSYTLDPVAATGRTRNVIGFHFEPNLVAFGAGTVSTSAFSTAINDADGPNVRAISATGTAKSYFGGDVTLAAKLISAQQTPASSSAPCTIGQRAADANFIYECTATNTWKRAALSTF